MNDEHRPRYSIVSAAYNVAAYLPEFIASIESQSLDLNGVVEVIMVDDGSTDATPRLLAEWAARRPDVVRVVTQANGGQGAARNRGILEARGEWITFPDPDDVLEPGYLAAVDASLTKEPDTDLVATNRLMWFEDENRVSDTHPLRFMFDGDSHVDLSVNRERFHGSSPASFFKLDEIRALDLVFDSRIRPNFEDGHFNSRYLLGHDRPRVTFLGSARYHYRKRADASSTLQTSFGDLRRYTDVPEYGYLDLIRRAREQYDEVPGWLTSFLLYELSWYLFFTDSKAPADQPTTGPAVDRFHELAAQILEALDVEAALPYLAPSVSPMIRSVLAHGFDQASWHDQFVVLDQLDTSQRLVRASYWFTGELPAETWRADGQTVAPLHAKIRAFDYLGRTLIRERIVWLPSNRSLQVELGGRPSELVYTRPHGPVRFAPPGQLDWWLSPESHRSREAVPQPLRRRLPRSRNARLASKLWHRRPARDKYADAWVLIDRVHDANDSAEILFRHLRRHHPPINAWFVLEKGGKEWDRFKAEGDGDRLVAYGSLQWMLLMANARHLLSSHADGAIINPAPVTEFTHPSWRFHFLQHGVIKDDLSSWLDPKPMDTFVTSTPAEHASIAGDDSPYVFTTREVAQTGLPRFDRIREIGLRFPPEKRDLLLVAPTWRNGLLPPIIEGTQRRELDLTLLDTYFVRAWLDYLTDPALAAACRAHNVTLGFLPHPNLQPLLPHLNLPAHVEPLTYEGGDPQVLFARARAFVTDFSSIAFNAAYLERPVVYYQFDADTVLGGGHVGRAGYFDYTRDGFGPVTADAATAVAATVEALANGPAPTPTYQARIDHTFPDRDGRCCERVIAHVQLTEADRSDLEPVATPAARGLDATERPD